MWASRLPATALRAGSRRTRRLPSPTSASHFYGGSRNATSAVSVAPQVVLSGEQFGAEFPEREATGQIFEPTERFTSRHIGPSEADVSAMLQTIGCESMEALISETVPAAIRLDEPLGLPTGRPEAEMLVRRAPRLQRQAIAR